MQRAFPLDDGGERVELIVAQATWHTQLRQAALPAGHLHGLDVNDFIHTDLITDHRRDPMHNNRVIQSIIGILPGIRDSDLWIEV